jgi:drug/metabolite transporter (DMT)-like permease
MLHTSLYFFALISLSTAPNWAKLSSMPVEVLGFYRLTGAACLIALFIVVKKRQLLLNLGITKQLIWVLLTAFLFFLHLYTYKFAAKNTSISNTMIIFSSNPIWASMGSYLFYKEKLTFRIFISYGLALLGVYLLVAGTISQNIGLGDVSALISAIFYAGYMLVSKKARAYYDNFIFAFALYLLTGLLFLASALLQQRTFTGYSNLSWLSVLGLIALPTLLGHMSMTYLVKFMDISIMTCGKLIEPVLASIMAYYIFNETLSPRAGIAFICTGAAVLVLFSPSIYKLIKNNFQE